MKKKVTLSSFLLRAAGIYIKNTFYRCLFIIDNLLISFLCCLLAGMFKESQLWQVHAERSASGSYAASVEVSPPPAGTVLQPIILVFYCSHKVVMSIDVKP